MYVLSSYFSVVREQFDHAVVFTIYLDFTCIEGIVLVGIAFNGRVRDMLSLVRVAQH